MGLAHIDQASDSPGGDGFAQLTGRELIVALGLAGEWVEVQVLGLSIRRGVRLPRRLGLSRRGLGRLGRLCRAAADARDVGSDGRDRLSLGVWVEGQLPERRGQGVVGDDAAQKALPDAA
ncbi:hypothetical protein [Nesterenkonia pannonica]|uniref:hypothetical protein n=1 Tax=Nesterenkonia pannonica TaxID=1548602 RepID=UPI00216477FB|nr:hypothetical protein [Nesterenkonia pannonica]